MKTEPTLKPKLTRDGPDAYIGTMDAWPDKPHSARPTLRVERDGDEWVRTDLSRPTWYPTLNAVRAHIAATNVARWVNGGAKRSNGRGGGIPEAKAFLSWVRSRYPACRGTVRHVSGLGSIESHDRCCDSTFGVKIPDDISAADLYLEWRHG